MARFNWEWQIYESANRFYINQKYAFLYLPIAFHLCLSFSFETLGGFIPSKIWSVAQPQNNITNMIQLGHWLYWLILQTSCRVSKTHQGNISPTMCETVWSQVWIQFTSYSYLQPGSHNLEFGMLTPVMHNTPSSGEADEPTTICYHQSLWCSALNRSFIELNSKQVQDNQINDAIA